MRRLVLLASWLLLLPAVAAAQVREALVVFKDGFSIKGKVIQKRDYIIDPISGRSFVIPKDGSFQYIDDDVRRIHFSPFQVQEVLPTKQGETRKDLIQIVKQRPIARSSMVLPGWTFEKAAPWNDKWERVLTFDTGRGKVAMRERIILLTPWHAYFMGVEYQWDQQFLTKELGPEFVLTLLAQHYGAQKDMTEIDRRLQIARFAQQAGWYGVALTELEKLVKEHAEAKERAQPQIDHLKQLRARLFVEDIERTHRIGQHQEAQARITAFSQDYLIKEADEKQRIVVQDLKAKYEAAKEKSQLARSYLKELPTRVGIANRPFWTVAANTIAEELTIDTLGRLDTFLSFAEQHERELKIKERKPGQSAEQVLAIAVSGWLQGNNLAEPDVKNATELFKARLMLREYVKTDDSVAREKLAADFAKENSLAVDMIARLVRNLPPILPYPKTTTDRHTLNVELPDVTEGTYLVQLPPDYSHHRQYPVVMLLHSQRDTAEGMMDRMKGFGAHFGYILAAPLWGGKGRAVKYEYSAREHAVALDCLRDLRRRFNVDSDRVFLFGWEAGGTMAFDVGLSHPDQFAGVLPMNGSCAMFPTRYASNGQYLPFYIVEGENNGAHAVASRELIKTWIRGRYPSIYVEYKGRTSEWYGWEIPTMFEWMDKKKRHHPARELGGGALVAGQGDEFKTLRESDNKFYFVGVGDISEQFLTDAGNYQKSKRPATVTASIAVGNEAGAKGAKIWNQINIRTTGVKKVSIWLAPNMIDFGKPVAVRIIGPNVQLKSRIIEPSLPTMLEEFYQSGDRQRLFYAKIDIKLGS